MVKPIQFAWDERGRLWALCAPSYPQLIPGIAANDYVLICEDTDGDGRADKFDRFAEGLVMPTGLAFGDGGVYVCQNTQLIHLRDSDGDGHADQRRVIFSGFGTGDSHQLINSLCWGPDGRLWFTQGLHIVSTIETPWGLIDVQSDRHLADEPAHALSCKIFWAMRPRRETPGGWDSTIGGRHSTIRGK